jgi:hypothetical protein
MPTKEQHIPTDWEVARIKKRLLGSYQELKDRFGCPRSMSAEAIIRFLAVSNSCKIARKNKWLTLKDVSSSLRVSKRRLMAIEESRLQEVRPQCLESYVEFLGLQAWFRRWIKANRKLAVNLKISS